MPQRFNKKKLVIASHNPGKVREISALLSLCNIEVISAAALGLAEPAEDGTTFIENANIKAAAAADASYLPALADDSGLVVPALDGKPGIHSARWAGPDKNFKLAMTKVWDKLANRDPAAYFICALSICWPQKKRKAGHIKTFEGRVDGKLVWPPRGERGFGYDPMFIPKGFNITFGEFKPADKHAISHRAIAFDKLRATCFPP